MSNDKAIRAFLAIEPPPEIRREISGLQKRLRSACPFEVRWVRPEGLHLTLKFFGDIKSADVKSLTPVVEKITAPFPPLRLNMQQLGLFPAGKHPRVLWIGLGGDVAPLLALQKDLEEDLQECGFPKEARPFRPHLTLGRIKTAPPAGSVAAFMAGADNVAAGSFNAVALELIQSDLTPQGAVYTLIARFPLQGG